MSIAQDLQSYVERATSALLRSNFDQLAQVAELLLKTRDSGHWVFIAGNGGSAATASHMANDLVKGLNMGKVRFKALALNDQVPVLTALANDYSYEVAYREQLFSYAGQGDVFVVFSGSGNSPNVVAAAEYAKSAGIPVISFGGRDGGKMKALSTIAVVAPTDSMEEIEDVHMCWEHALITALKSLV